MLESLPKSSTVLRSEPIQKNKIGELVISTIFSPDHGYETAIQDNTGMFLPVARYDNRNDSLDGHWQWCKEAPNLDKITVLGSDVYGVTSFVHRIVR